MSDNTTKQNLIQAALEARKASYSPYSNYAVGAALLTEDGEVYTGTNIENAAYSTTICAERVAIFKAVSERHKGFTQIAVVTRDGGTPCGSCRQVMAEFGLEAQVTIADKDGNVLEETTVKELLPGAFGPSNLLENS